MIVTDLTKYNIDDEKLNKVIANYSLPIRVQNAIKLKGIYTLGQLLFHIVRNERIRNVGEKSMQYIYKLFEQENILWEEFLDDSIRSLKLSPSLSGVFINAGYVLVSSLSNIKKEHLFYLLDKDYAATEKIYKKLTAQSDNKKQESPNLKCNIAEQKGLKKFMNGELRPMDWNQFKQLLDKEQKKYICAILNEYKVSTKQLADMLGVSASILRTHLKSLGVEPPRYKITDTARFRNEFCCRRHGKLEYNSTTLHYQNYNLNMINSDLEFLLSQNSNPVSITILVEYS